MSGVKWESGELEKADLAVTCHGNGGACKGWGREERKRREKCVFWLWGRKRPLRVGEEGGWDTGSSFLLGCPCCPPGVGL